MKFGDIKEDGIKASEMVEKLKEMIKEHGDLNMCFETEAYGPWKIEDVILVKANSKTYIGGSTGPPFDIFMVTDQEDD